MIGDRNMERSNYIQVNTGIKIVYHITLVISMLVGFWHFFVPNLYKWYDYLPMQYENLIVGIDYRASLKTSCNIRPNMI